jgi:hypothetical protein
MDVAIEQQCGAGMAEIVESSADRWVPRKSPYTPGGRPDDQDGDAT